MSTNLKITHVDRIGEESTFFCKLCGFPLRSRDDFEASKDYDCCNNCYLTYVESRRKEWKEGWRPDKETLEEYIYMRKFVLLNQEKK